ncbi:MAG: MBL fold metallo-hydrolase [Acidimicrobiales bacterium]
MTLERGNVRVLTGIDEGAYPHGNSVLVTGEDESVLIDPSLSVARWGGVESVDRVVLSHVHEDHVAGLAQFAGVPVHAHREDVGALTSLEAMIASYGLDPGAEAAFADILVDEFNFVARPDVVAYEDGAIFEVGGSTIEVIATPGHTPGHCCLLVQPEAVLYLGDIELTGFGPYYADRHSSLDAFEASIERCRHIEAEWFVTFHHKGTYTDRSAFLAQLDVFAAAIERRDALLLDYLTEPQTMAQLVQRRVLYRPHVELAWLDSAERRTIELHLDRLVQRGLVRPDGDHWTLT